MIACSGTAFGAFGANTNPATGGLFAQKPATTGFTGFNSPASAPSLNLGANMMGLYVFIIFQDKLSIKLH